MDADLRTGRRFQSIIYIYTVKPAIATTSIKQVLVLCDPNIYCPLYSIFHINITYINRPHVLYDHVLMFPWKIT